MQIRAEIAGFLSDSEAALKYLTASVDAGMFDLAWFDRCPLLAPLRQDRAFSYSVLASRSGSSLCAKPWLCPWKWIDPGKTREGVK